VQDVLDGSQRLIADTQKSLGTVRNWTQLQLTDGERHVTTTGGQRGLPESFCCGLLVTAFCDMSHSPSPELRGQSINLTQRASLMSDSIGTSNARLEKLVRRIMKEKDPVAFDELCSELWLVLKEREYLAHVEGRVDRASETAACRIRHQTEIEVRYDSRRNTSPISRDRMVDGRPHWTC
jgi:hypothetical protein